MMGTCVVLFVMAWAVVRVWSVPAAIVMCLVAMTIPPFAAIVANRRLPGERWFDEQDGDEDGESADGRHGRSRGLRHRSRTGTAPSCPASRGRRALRGALPGY